MTVHRSVTIGAIAAATALLAWLLFVGLPRWYGGRTTDAAAARPAAAEPTSGRKIKGRLFYVSEEGTRLLEVEREIPFAEGTTEQARQIIEAQIAPVGAPLLSAVPAGTKLRTLFVTERGEAFVDLSHEVVSGHSGGSTNEALTVYTFVSALTANLPAVTSVQLLVDGKQVDTLAGHIDLRRPLERNPAWLQ